MLKHIRIYLRAALRRITKEQAEYELTQRQTREQWLKDYDETLRREERK